ncbi:hypothetical protein PA598K_06881 [Paenibacillus sp. 598K]|uniref:hypothetical protein n=1 Tax=Paenibacillus sp. 598K TaxID=1117987 RepID=UPI000FFA26F4|nr:hypothetical protein [Paenibacillus sp. 598K]GBF78263.1 hypothetical protein PA598K_06881 [Paenibacillus sp. 598K]
MFPISPVFEDLLKRRDREWMVKVDINGVEYTNNQIVEFLIENSLTLNQEFEIGTATASKFILKLRTPYEIPANARMRPYLALSTAGMTWGDATYPWAGSDFPWGGENSGTDWLQLGEFYVDSREQNKDIWTFTCFDALIFAEVPYVSSLIYPARMQDVWDEICDRLGFVYEQVHIDPAYTIPVAPTGYTTRQVMGFIAASNAASVYVSKTGTIRFRRFTAADQPVFQLSESDYMMAKKANPLKTYTRFVITYDEEEDASYTVGSGDENHTLYINNPFATPQIANGILAAMNGFSYVPVAMDARGYPQLEMGDRISYLQYEGNTWETAIKPWEDTDVPWDGLSRYETIIMHQVFDFRGGLSMSVDSPSQSEQQSEYPVVGTVTSEINRLSKSAVKQGRNYFGVNISKERGLVVDRSDGLASSVWNSDEFRFTADGEDALWFDVPSRKFMFSGTLEGADGRFSGTIEGGRFVGGSIQIGSSFSVDESGHMKAVGGEFSGTISAAVFNGGQINGTTITGTTIRGSTIIAPTMTTSEGTGQRVAFEPGGFRSYDNNGVKRISIDTNDAFGYQELRFWGQSGGHVGTVSGTNGQLNINAMGANALLVGGASVVFGGQISSINFQDRPVTGFPISNVSGLSSALSARALAGAQTGNSQVYNAGIPIGTQLMIAGGGTVTWTGIPAHSHPQT